MSAGHSDSPEPTICSYSLFQGRGSLTTHHNHLDIKLKPVNLPTRFFLNAFDFLNTNGPDFIKSLDFQFKNEARFDESDTPKKLSFYVELQKQFIPVCISLLNKQDRCVQTMLTQSK